MSDVIENDRGVKNFSLESQEKQLCKRSSWPGISVKKEPNMQRGVIEKEVVTAGMYLVSEPLRLDHEKIGQEGWKMRLKRNDSISI